MTFPEVNLARRPFANSRPVVRISIALWVIGGLLAVGNAFLYGRSLTGMEETEERIAATRQSIREERERIADAEERLQGMDLREQNELAAYLNDRIDERTFPWSQLFDHMAEVLPREVRLHNLRPRRVASGPTGPRGLDSDGEGEELVGLSMMGHAQDDEALLGYLDNLFASPWFENPQLASEAREPDNSLRFQLTVTYLPATRRARSVPEVGLASVEEVPDGEEAVGDGVPAGAAELTLRAGEETASGVLPRSPGSPTRDSRAAPPTADRAGVASTPPPAVRPDAAPGARALAPGTPRLDERPGPAVESERTVTVPVPIRPSASRPGGPR